MKTYIKPNTAIINIELDKHLLAISGEGEEELKGGSNGTYSDNGTITLGSRRSVWDDDEEDEE